MGNAFSSVVGGVIDNPYTRAWQRGVDRVVTGPAGRVFASDEVLRSGVAGMATELAGSGITDRQVQILNNMFGGSLTKDVLEARLREKMGITDNVFNEGLLAQELGNRVYSMMGNVDRRKRVDAAAAMSRELEGRMGLTNAGTRVRQWVTGSPLGAYGAAATAGGLGVLAIAKLVDYLQAQDNVDEQGSGLSS